MFPLTADTRKLLAYNAHIAPEIDYEKNSLKMMINLLLCKEIFEAINVGLFYESV